MCSISVIVPVYRAEAFLEDCVRSVLQQDYPHWELLLVEDGSPDASGALCDELAKLDGRIRVFHRENAGALASRVYAVEHARGDVLVFLDSDDYLQPNALSVISATMEQTGCDCVVYGMQRVRDGKVIATIREDGGTVELTDKRQMYLKILLDQDYNPVCRKAMKKALFAGQELSEYYHVRFGEDLLQSMHPMRACKKMVFIPDVLYNYRQNPDSVTQNLRADTYRVDFSARQYVLRFLSEEKVFTREDMRVYRGYCIYLLCVLLRTIGWMNEDNRTKRRYYEQIRQSAYYREFLNTGEYDPAQAGDLRILFILLQKGMYGVMLACLWLRRKIRR